MFAEIFLGWVAIITFFKWYSIFKPSYIIVVLTKNNDFLMTMAQNYLHHEFLKNNPLVLKVKIFFTLEKTPILNLEEYEKVFFCN